MEREIKFRAWSGVSMHYFDISDTISPSMETDIMQYTGLKDKNGKEIYESDFVKVNGRIRLIEWRNAMFCCKGVEYHLGTVWFSGGAPEIVGNLFQNPELL